MDVSQLVHHFLNFVCCFSFVLLTQIFADLVQLVGSAKLYDLRNGVGQFGVVRTIETKGHP